MDQSLWNHVSPLGYVESLSKVPVVLLSQTVFLYWNLWDHLLHWLSPWRTTNWDSYSGAAMLAVSDTLDNMRLQNYGCLTLSNHLFQLLLSFLQDVRNKFLLGRFHVQAWCIILLFSLLLFGLLLVSLLLFGLLLFSLLLFGFLLFGLLFFIFSLILSFFANWSVSSLVIRL